LARIERSRKPVEKSAEPSGEAGAADIEKKIIGKSAAMEQVRRMIAICTRSDANVLLFGETGVGKDLISMVIHRCSHRYSFPYIKVGCTLFPPQLIESELYGHEKGSFTGAEQQRRGRFDLAEGGTLYLDDVDDIRLEQQAKLLRAIEEKVFERVGGTNLIKADVRIVTSTKRNLLRQIGEGTFREDLFYRLDVLRINIPPLRDRREDTPELAEHLLQRIAKDRSHELDSDALDLLQQHDWPGNVRELYHTLERAFLVGSGRITADLIDTSAGPAFTGAGRPLPTNDFQAAIQQTEHDLLNNALKATGGNKTAAAAALGMKPSTFRDKLSKYGLG